MEIEVATTAELGVGDRKVVMVDDDEIAVLNVDGEYFAVKNYCPHMEGPLGLGPANQQDGCAVVACPFHGWEFDLETGESLYNIKKQAVVYEVKVEKGKVFLLK